MATGSAKWVYAFGDGKAEGKSQMRDLLGGKGANLAEMSNLGLPVPPGFTITTEVCTYLLRPRQVLPAGAEGSGRGGAAQVGALTGRRFGDATNPLLVSVRSGARASMPGMMDTVLNLGLNDETVLALAKEADDERFAYDSYRRFITMYSNVVLGVEHHAFEEALEQYKEGKGFELDTELGAADWKTLIQTYKTIVRTSTARTSRSGADDQLWGAIGAVFNSWMIPRAKKYRELNSIPESWGTAVNVQAMVFGNMGDTSATGVAFTRNPSTGEKALYGEFLINAQGEDVVAGIRTPQNITEKATNRGRERQAFHGEGHARELRGADPDLRDPGEPLPRHAGHGVHHREGEALDAPDPQRQAHGEGRPAHRRGSGGEGVISREEAIGRVEPGALDQLLHPTIDPKADRKVIASGLPASPGAATGEIVFNSEDAEAHRKAERKCILVRIETSPGGHPRHARRRGHPDHPRRHDQPRGRGRPRHGQALRLGRRVDPDRLQGADPHGRRPRR